MPKPLNSRTVKITLSVTAAKPVTQIDLKVAHSFSNLTCPPSWLVHNN